MPLSAIRRVLASLTLSLLAAAAASAQTPAGIRPGDLLEGTVIFDGAPAPGLSVALHRVTSQSSGEASTGVTDAAGRFSFPLVPDSASEFTIFFVTAENHGVRYFGPPVHSSTAVPEEYAVTVYDTASVLPQPMRVVTRMVAMAALPEGAWEMNEAITLLNPNPVALVAAPGAPTWQIGIPEGASDFEVGEGDIFPHEVTLMDDRVMLLTPIPPGSRLLYMRYRLPARPTHATIPIGEPTDTLNLFVLQPSHLSEVVGLTSLSRVTVPNNETGTTEEYLQYSATGLTAPSAIELSWSGAWSSPVDPVVAALVVTVLLLAAGAFVAFRNRPPLPRA